MTELDKRIEEMLNELDFKVGGVGRIPNHALKSIVYIGISLTEEKYKPLLVKALEALMFYSDYSLDAGLTWKAKQAIADITKGLENG